MSNNIKKTKLNLITSIFYQVVTIALGLLIPRITLVGYGSETNGLVSSALQFVGYLVLFEAGVQAVAIKALYKPVATNDRDEINSILSAVKKSYNRIGVFYFIGLVLLSFFYSLFIKKSEISFLTSFFVVFFSGLSNVVLFFTQGKYRILLTVEGKGYFLSVVNVITSLCNHAVRIILLYLRVDISIVVFGSFLVSLIPATIVMIYIKKYYKWINLKVPPKNEELKQSKFVIIHQISWLIFNNTDVLLLTLFCNLKVVSVYAIYKMICGYISTFSKMPLDSCSFRLGQLFNTNKERFTKIQDVLEVSISGLCFALFTVTICLILPFIKLYTRGVEDVKYDDVYVAILFVLSELLAFVRTPMNNIISYAGHFRETTVQTVMEMLINLIVSIVGVIFLGIYGVLLGTVAALLYRTVDIIIYSNKKLLNRSSLKTLSIYIVYFIVTAIIYFVYSKFINIDITSYIKFVIVGFVLTVSVVLIYLLVIFTVFRKEAKTILQYVKNKIRKRA